MATFDISILGDPANEESLLDVDNTVATGVYKLVQRVLILLFKDIDDPKNFGLGTSLPNELFGANVQNAEVLLNNFNIATSRVKDIIINDTPLDAPEDEKLTDIRTEIIFTEIRDSAEAELTVLTEAGDQVTVKVPVSELSILQADDEDIPILGG